MNNPKALENLLPDSTVEDFILEVYNIGLCTLSNRNQLFLRIKLTIIFMQLFDGYNNHVAEGTDVLIHIDGYRIEDWMGINRKV